MAEVDAFVQEQSALVDINTVYQIYKLATEDKPYSFLFVKLREWCEQHIYDTNGEGDAHRQ